MTRLPDGQWLLLGGEGELADQVLLVGTSVAPIRLVARPLHPRNGHSATVLPDGRVLVLGGVDPSGAIVVQPEIFDPANRVFNAVSIDGLIPRAYHSATVVSDGRVLVAGGVDEQAKPVTELELWNPATGGVEVANAVLAIPRLKHRATLLPSGHVVLSDGVGGDGKPVDTAEVFDPVTGRVQRITAADAHHMVLSIDDTEAPAVVSSTPAAEARNIGGLEPLIVRFNKHMAAASLRVTLVGPAGAEPARIVPVEQGMLAFVWPAKELLPASRYTLFLEGADSAQRLLPLSTIGFDTAGKPAGLSGLFNMAVDEGSVLMPDAVLPGVQEADLDAQRRQLGAAEQQLLVQADGTADSEDWVPGPKHFKGRWRADRASSPLQTLTPLQAPPGVTALSGQVLGMNGRAVPGVTLRIAGQEARSDVTGRFLVPGLPPGFAKLEIDGATADRPGARYGYYAARIELKAGQTTVVPYVIWMPRLDPAGTVQIAAPTTAETVVTSPRIPGLELHIPAGTVIRNRQGHIVTELNLTAIPVDRPPFPVPDLSVPVYFTIQPGGAVLQSVNGKPSAGARLFYPNFKGEVPGARGVFWNYDPEGREWFVYGLGTISPDARQAIPDDGVTIRELTGAMFDGSNAPPPRGPPPPRHCEDGPAGLECPLGEPPTKCSDDGLQCVELHCPGGPLCDEGGDPVSLFTGQFDHTEHDLQLADVMPIDIVRTYNSADKNQRAFGIGMTHAYDVFLFSQNQYQEVDLILPNATRIHYVRTSPGTDFFDAILTSSAPGQWNQSKVVHDNVRFGWDLIFRDGRKWYFQELQPLLEMTDANGNVTRIVRQDDNGASGKVARVISPSGRTVEFTYNAAGFVSALTDNLGRTWSYNYDTGGRLVSVIDPLGGTRTYTWDTSSNQITELHDANGNLVVRNQYSRAGRVQLQTMADGSHFSYSSTAEDGTILDELPQFKPTLTYLTDQRGVIRRVEFNSEGNIIRNTFALGLAEEQITSYELSDGQVTASVDALNRRTEYQYDTSGNTTRVTRLAGTADAAVTAITYDPIVAKPLTITDPNGNVTTLAYNAQGNLISITDALGHTATFTYDSQGRRLTTTDPLGKVTTLTYDGPDLASTTDPLGRRVQYLSDAAGRVVAAVDPLGNRTVYEWDDLSRQLRAIDPLGGITSFSYDAVGNLLSHTDANRNTASYQYNALNKVQLSRDALGKEETSSYDVDGSLKQKTDRKGQLRSVTYDALGRVKTVRSGASAAHPTAFTSQLEYTWDAASRLAQVVESTCGDPNCSTFTAASVITRTYDGLDRMVSEITPQGEVDYTYDGVGRRTSMTIKNGPPGAQVTQPIVTYTYDNANRLGGIRQAAGSINAGMAQTIAFAYDAAGRRTQTTLANGVVVSYTYDDAGQLKAMVTKKDDGTLVGDLQYEYDAAGRRISMGGSLAQLVIPPADVADAAYDVNNRLVTWGGKAYVYDDNGNMAGNGTNEFQWDDRDRLTSIRSGGSQIVGFQYDAQGRRVGRTSGSVTTGFLYDGPNVAQELDGTSNTAVVKAHLLTGRIDEVFLRLEGNAGASLLSVVSDANNNTLMLLDAAESSIASYTYEPYGMTTADGTSVNNHQYTGRENDSPGNAEGLYYYRARYYMPGVARFIAEDPIGWASGQTNNYAYAGGDPINLRDPTGFDAIPHPKLAPFPGTGRECRNACWGQLGGVCAVGAGVITAACTYFGTPIGGIICTGVTAAACGHLSNDCAEDCPP